MSLCTSGFSPFIPIDGKNEPLNIKPASVEPPDVILLSKPQFAILYIIYLHSWQQDKCFFADVPNKTTVIRVFLHDYQVLSWVTLFRSHCILNPPLCVHVHRKGSSRVIVTHLIGASILIPYFFSFHRDAKWVHELRGKYSHNEGFQTNSLWISGLLHRCT